MGLAASLFTIAEVATKTSTFIRKIKRAPNELLALHNEVTEIQNLVSQTQVLSDHDLTANTVLASALNHAASRACAVQLLLNDIEKHPRSFRAKWPIYEKEARQLQNDLRGARAQLNGALTLSNAWVTACLNMSRCD